MEEALRNLLRNSAGVYALVGGSAGAARVNWGALPQKDAMPGVALHDQGGPVLYTLRGLEQDAGTLVQIDCWALTAKAARDLRAAVRAALRTINDTPTDTLRGAFIERRHAGTDRGKDGAPDFYRSSLDCRVWSPTV